MTPTPRAALSRRPAPEDRPRVRKILTLLAKDYPQARCALHHSNPLELLVATVLSAQCTDVRVNQVTPALFRAYRMATDYASAPQSQIETDIRSTGFFRSKARSIRGICDALVRRHDGEVPRTMEELVALPGVGRKTANLVLAEAFGIPGMVVDTHVGRISQRLGLTQNRQADRIEQDLCKVIPRDEWNSFGLRLIEHGRRVCKARRPLCDGCSLLPVCPHGISRA